MPSGKTPLLQNCQLFCEDGGMVAPNNSLSTLQLPTLDPIGVFEGFMYDITAAMAIPSKKSPVACEK